jgi:hypothetical protein
MKTFSQLMEQIPHMVQNPIDLVRARMNQTAKYRQRLHVERERMHTADYENKRKSEDIA